jgi:hypothetical protein
MYCKDCEVKLTRSLPEFRSKADGWIDEHWFPSKNWKCLQCESCGFFVQSHSKNWEELEEEAIATGRVIKDLPVSSIDYVNQSEF